MTKGFKNNRIEAEAMNFLNVEASKEKSPIVDFQIIWTDKT